MAEANWLRHTIQVGIFEFRRSTRAIWEDKARAFLMAAGLVFPSLMLVGFIYLFSDVIRNAGPVILPPVARGTIALFWLFGVFLATQRVVSARPRIDAEPLMLTTISPRTAAGGLVLAETLRVLAYLALPVVVLTGGVVYLFGSLSSVLIIPLTAVLFGLTAVCSGMVLGYTIALLIATSPFVAKHKTILGGVAVVVAMGGHLLLTLPQFGGIGQESLAILPVGWFIDIAVIGTPVQGSVVRAAVILGGSLVIVVAGTSLIEYEATRFWFTDPVSGYEDSQSESGPLDAESDGTQTALADVVAPAGIPAGISQPTRRVAQWSLLRTRRDPRRLNFLLLPVVMVGSGLINAGLQAPSPWTVFAPAAAVLLSWVAGATFAMNPFGDEGAVLPVTLLSIPGSAYVRGLMLPGMLFGAPLVVLISGAGALIGGFQWPVVLGLVGIGLLATVVAVTSAPAVGLWFPRFSAISIGQSREVIPPRLVTTAVHFLSVTIPATFLTVLLLEPQLARTLLAGTVGYLPAAVLQLISGGDGGILSPVGMQFHSLGKAIESVTVETFQTSASGVLILGAVIVAVVSYRFAIRRFDSYSPPM